MGSPTSRVSVQHDVPEPLLSYRNHGLADGASRFERIYVLLG
jgi:hypothetical protein